ncbi:hypothetical protein LXL04_034592 [Taraxacum kok-saghyz]
MNFTANNTKAKKLNKRVKTSAVCGPHLQTSAAEEVDQKSAVCNKKTKLLRNRNWRSCSRLEKLLRNRNLEKEQVVRSPVEKEGLLRCSTGECSSGCVEKTDAIERWRRKGIGEMKKKERYRRNRRNRSADLRSDRYMSVPRRGRADVLDYTLAKSIVSFPLCDFL